MQPFQNGNDSKELGRTDNVGIRFAAAVALLFNVMMVIVVMSPRMIRDLIAGQQVLRVEVLITALPDLFQFSR
jgi:hypothetical protein